MESMLPVKIFPSTFINLCHAGEELESNAKCSRFGEGGGVNILQNVSM